MMQVTTLRVASVLIIALTASAASASTWGVSRILTTTSQQRNPWQRYGITQNDEPLRTESMVLLQHLVSIRGGSSATGKY